MVAMQVRVLTWNLFHGRDFPPHPTLFTWRSRLLRCTERGETHVQVNRDLFAEFAGLLAPAPWDVALLQECPPRWVSPLAAACDAGAHRALTSRNSLGAIRAALARLNPDLIASNEGGSNLTLARGGWSISERRELELARGPSPERRVMAFSRLSNDAARLCIGNLHLSAGRARLPIAERELLRAAEWAVEWSGADPLILGGDINIRPLRSDVFDRLAERHGLSGTTAPDSLDHVLARGVETVTRRTWADAERDVPDDGLAIRLSDHAPVEATFSVKVK
jgi:endonuclease/exonuclease/phosphatase family metal-dependent hydrolase